MGVRLIKPLGTGKPNDWVVLVLCEAGEGVLPPALKLASCCRPGLFPGSTYRRRNYQYC